MKDKLHTEELYLPGDEEIMREQLRCLDRLYDFNATRPTELDKRDALLHEMFAEVGEGCYIEPPLHSNWGGKHVHFGDRAGSGNVERIAEFRFFRRILRASVNGFGVQTKRIDDGL